ncbi:hypothetical protein D3C87_300830 [compost metagenome]
MKKSLVFLCVLVWGYSTQSAAYAAQATKAFDNYYTVHEKPKLSFDSEIALDPLTTAQDIFEQTGLALSELKAQVLFLLNFDHHGEAYGDLSESYHRQIHFGTWVRDRGDGTCFNTRAQVLIRDSEEDVSYTSTNCTVSTGKWTDPYTGKVYTRAGEIDIDHFVPLKHAYISGAHKWNSARRCLYANYRGNDFHLLSVGYSENRRKGDKSPERYMPPDAGYQCQYLSQWLKVKLIWSLELTPPEKEALLQLVQDNGCSRKDFEYPVGKLTQQRQTINDKIDLCER